MNTSSDPRLNADLAARLLADTSPYLSCDECFERIDEYAERVVADAGYRDEAMQVHLAACGVCAEEAEALLELLQR